MSTNLDPRLLALGQPDLDDDSEDEPLLGVLIAVMVCSPFWGFVLARWWLA